MQITSHIISSKAIQQKDKVQYFQFHDSGFQVLQIGKLHELEIIYCKNIVWEQETEQDKAGIIVEYFKEQKSGYFIMNTPQFTLIPTIFFDQNLVKDYLFIHKKDWNITHTTYCDPWNKKALVLAYTIPHYILNTLQTAPDTTLYHLLSSLNYMMQKKQQVRGRTIFVYIQKEKFLLWAADNDQFFFAEEYVFMDYIDASYKILSLCKFLKWDKTQVYCHIIFFDRMSNKFADLLSNNHFNLLVPNPEIVARKFKISFREKPELTDFFLLLYLATCEL